MSPKAKASCFSLYSKIACARVFGSGGLYPEGCLKMVAVLDHQKWLIFPFDDFANILGKEHQVVAVAVGWLGLVGKNTSAFIIDDISANYNYFSFK